MGPFVIALLVTQLSMSHGWSYHDQGSWPEKFCQKSVAQSPIDIETRSTVKQYFKPLKGSNWQNTYNATVTNNGHTVQVTLSNDRNITILGGGLPGKFIFSQFHFHWDSEHTIDRRRKALEAHFVFYNSKFASQDEAVGYTNGIAVFAVLYDLSQKDNEPLKPIIEGIDKIQSPQHSFRTTIRLLDLLPRDRTRFYRYWGSLTTPDCNDIVVWTIFTETCKISQKQVDKLASIKDSHGEQLKKNYRDLQQLNCRHVYEGYAVAADSS